MKLLRNLIFHRYFPSAEFSRDPHLIQTPMKLLRNSDFHRCFLNVDFFRGLRSVYFWWNYWEVCSFIDIFSECGIFQRSTLSNISMKLLRSLMLSSIFLQVWNFSEDPNLVHISMKLLRSLDFHRYFPIVGIFQRSTPSTFTMKLLRSFGLSSRFSKCGIFQKVNT